MQYSASEQPPSRTPPQAPKPDSQSIILHFDADAFYAQCEELRNPDLVCKPLGKNRFLEYYFREYRQCLGLLLLGSEPVHRFNIACLHIPKCIPGVTQKFLIVTCNYIARDRNVSKLMSIKEARRRCPDIVLVSGEDLTPYREGSKAMRGVLRRYGPSQKVGLDEVFVDVTEEVEKRLLKSSLHPDGGGQDLGGVDSWGGGHLYSPEVPLLQDNQHRIMDLRESSRNIPVVRDSKMASNIYSDNLWYKKLLVGSVIAAEAREAVRRETGIRTSAGIACNRLLAKLVSGLHKPDGQTTILPVHAAGFVAPLDVRILHGVGHKLQAELNMLGITTVGQLRSWPRHQLVQRFGPRIAGFLAEARWGKDSSQVVEQGPSNTVSVEDSFRHCRGMTAAAHVVTVLAPDLLARLREEDEENRRVPSRLVMQWRLQGEGWKRHSASCSLPTQMLDWKPGTGDEKRTNSLITAACKLLSTNVQEPFDLTLINLGATGFRDRPSGGGGGAAAAASTMYGARPFSSGQPQIVQPCTVAPQVSASSGSDPQAANHFMSRRRDYGTGLTPASRMSKHQERMLREGQQASAVKLSVNQTSTWGEREEEETRGEMIYDACHEEDGSLWSDLAGLHSSKEPPKSSARVHCEGMARRSCSTSTTPWGPAPASAAGSACRPARPAR